MIAFRGEALVVEVRGSRSAKHGGNQQTQLVGCPTRLPGYASFIKLAHERFHLLFMGKDLPDVVCDKACEMWI